MNKNNLHNIKNSGFKTPKNYFDSFEDSVMNQIKLQEKIEDSGFRVPSNYFDSLDDKILGKVAHEPKVIPLFTKRNLLYVSSIAAAIVLMFNIIGNNKQLTFDDLEIVSIENYLSEENIDTQEFASLLTEDELTADNFIDTNITDEALEDYIMQNATIEDLIIE